MKRWIGALPRAPRGGDQRGLSLYRHVLPVVLCCRLLLHCCRAQHHDLQGVHALPRRVRVRMDRIRNDDDDEEDSMYTVVSLVPVDTFKGLQHTRVE